MHNVVRAFIYLILEIFQLIPDNELRDLKLFGKAFYSINVVRNQSTNDSIGIHCLIFNYLNVKVQFNFGLFNLEIKLRIQTVLLIWFIYLFTYTTKFWLNSQFGGKKSPKASVEKPDLFIIHGISPTRRLMQLALLTLRLFIESQGDDPHVTQSPELLLK